MKRFGLASLIMLAASLAMAEDKPLMQDVWKEVLRKGTEAASTVKNVGKPRVVPKGAKPEIVLKKDQIWIDGKLVAIGQPFQAWENALADKLKCSVPKPKNDIRYCVSDRLGIALGSSMRNTKVVKFFKIYVNLEQLHPYGVATHRPDGTPRPPPVDTRPKHSFPGYLELDGYGIDAKSQFWEIRAGSDPWRELRCGLRDCAHPHGAFSETATLYLRLNSSTEHGNVYEFTISGREEYPPQKAVPGK